MNHFTLLISLMVLVGAHGACTDDPDFIFHHEGREKYCTSLSDINKDLCNDTLIAQACANSCDSCNTSRPAAVEIMLVAPLTQPRNSSTKHQQLLISSNKPHALNPSYLRGHSVSVVISSNKQELCRNNPDFHLPWHQTDHHCKWIRWKEHRRLLYCQSDIVRQNCPQACGLCCDDDPAYSFMTDEVGKKEDCEWISTNNKNIFERAENYCDKFYDDRTVRDGKAPVTIDAFVKQLFVLNFHIDGNLTIIFTSSLSMSRILRLLPK